MKGIVFNLLEAVVQREYDDDTWDALLSRAPANGRWNGLFAWDEGCGGKYAGKIDADGGCCETGGLARAVEIGAARRSGPGAGDPIDAGGAEGRGDRRGARSTCQHGAELAGLLCTWRGGGAAAAPAARTAGQDRAACRGDRGGDPGRRCAPRWREDAAAPVCRDRPARWAGDLAAGAVAPIAPKGFALAAAASHPQRAPGRSRGRGQPSAP